MPKVCIEIDCTSEQLNAITAILSGSLNVKLPAVTATPTPAAMTTAVETAPAAATEIAAPAEKKKRGKKADAAPATEAAATPPAAPPAAPAAPAAESGETIEAVRKVVIEACEKLTIPVVTEALLKVAGVRKAGQVPEDKFGAVIGHLRKLIQQSDVI